AQISPVTKLLWKVDWRRLVVVIAKRDFLSPGRRGSTTQASIQTDIENKKLKTSGRKLESLQGDPTTTLSRLPLGQSGRKAVLVQPPTDDSYLEDEEQYLDEDEDENEEAIEDESDERAADNAIRQ